MKTMNERIEENGLSIICTQVDNNPNMPEWKDADHWKCIIRFQRSKLTIYFSQGYGHNGKEPKLTDVLDCLASDASGFENAGSFEDWANEYGYDYDSRKAERIYETIERQAKRLKKFLGESLYNKILWETESE